MGVELPLRVVVTILECCVTFSGVKLSIRSFVLFLASSLDVCKKKPAALRDLESKPEIYSFTYSSYCLATQNGVFEDQEQKRIYKTGTNANCKIPTVMKLEETLRKRSSREQCWKQNGRSLEEQFSKRL